MNKESSGQVALLVDFENLIGNEENDSSGTSHAKRLVDFAKEYGRVVISKAYANWNYPSYGKYQLGIYDCGIEPVQVLGQTGKNSVDIKLAVDAVDMMRSLPYINVFIIVSSDKDFIHLYKILRVQGKIVIGVALHRNPILERSCDHFILYQNLAGTSEKGSSEIQMVGASEDINEGAQSTGLAPEVTVPGTAAGEVVSADSVAPEVTAPDAPAAEDISQATSSYTTEDK